MGSYSNSSVVQCLRHYDMFANSLNLVKTREKKEMIIKQLTKLENDIIKLTNEAYEEEYYELANKECGLIDEELNRLNSLVDLINKRLSYIEKRCNSHYQLTGESIDIDDVIGANTLDNLEERIKIIEKYEKNIKLEKELKNEVDALNNKIVLASEKISINESLNKELESKFCELLSNSFEECGFYEYLDNKDEIDYAYYETEKSLSLAELNLETAKNSSPNIFAECQEILDEVKKDYIEYKEKLSILKLMEIFNDEVNNYEELLSKRKEVNELFRYIKNTAFIEKVMDTISKQYNTILMEQHDVNTYNDLVLERDRKMAALSEIDDENNSESFQIVLEELIRNENARQARILEEQQRIEEEEKKKRLEIERKKREEILKRQKIIEDARKKEIEKRTKLLLEQQQKSVLQTNKKEVSFENIKDISNKSNIVEEFGKDKNVKEINVEDVLLDTVKKPSDIDEQKEDAVLFKNKVDIEKELFDEFNNGSLDIDLDNEQQDNNIEENKLPDISIDEYMKNFDESSFQEKGINSLLDDDNLFPTIPL